MQEYYEKLCKKFPEITFNTGSSLMSGNENKVVINLSSECLKKMANDPEFAKKVEFNLTGAVPGQNRMFAQAKAEKEKSQKKRQLRDGQRKRRSWRS